MRNVLILTKNYLLNLIGSLSRQFNKSKFIVAGIFLFLIGIAAIGSLAYTSYITLDQFIVSENEIFKEYGIAVNLTPYAMLLNFVTLILIMLLSLIFKSSSVDDDKDLEMLLSLPIKKHHILISKSLVSYIIDFSLYLLLFLPSVIIYYIVLETSITVVINSLILVFILPLLTNGFEFIISYFLKKTNINKKIESLVQITLMVVLLLSMLMFNFYINNVLINDTTLSFTDLLDKLLPIKLMFNFVMENNFLNLLIIIIIGLVIYSIGLILKVNNLGKKNRNKVIRKTNTYEENTVFKDLLKKEANRYFTTPLYVINSIFGVFLIIGASIYIMMQGKAFLDDIIYQLIKLDSVHTPAIILFVTSAIFSTVCTTYCSISIEGKNFWELKVLPIDVKTIFNSKLAFNFILLLSGALISDIFICIVLGFKYFIIYLLFHLLFSYFISILGLYLNLLFPKLDYKSINVLVKQSISLVLVMSIGALVSVIFLVLYILIGKFFIVYLILLVLLIINYILTKLLYSKGIKLFNNLN